ncbi:MAG: HK97 gp10 family phage protein, partial [Clostridia bacterium]|nr:HK97 gp10 family phage protein [Clostridia bacterium]
MNRNVSIGEMADAIMSDLQEYADAAAMDVKAAVRKSANTVKKQIGENAPVGKTGRYAKSWRVKTTEENSQKLVQTVHSPKRYMLAHLLEKGHAKRNGGRTRA